MNENQNLTGDKAIKPENLAGTVAFKLKIKTYMKYMSEHMPMYTLMIEDKELTIEKNENLERRITTEAQNVAKDSISAFSSSSFISAPAIKQKL